MVVIADGNGKIVKETTVGGLLPDAFQPKHLGKG
jgi:hypothetical protein